MSTYFCPSRLSVCPCRCGEKQCNRMWPSCILTFGKHESELIAQHASSCWSRPCSLVHPVTSISFLRWRLYKCHDQKSHSSPSTYSATQGLFLMANGVFQHTTASACVSVFRLILSEQEKLVERPCVARVNPCLSNAERAHRFNSFTRGGVYPIISLSHVSLHRALWPRI